MKARKLTTLACAAALGMAFAGSALAQSASVGVSANVGVTSAATGGVTGIVSGLLGDVTNLLGGLGLGGIL